MKENPNGRQALINRKGNKLFQASNNKDQEQQNNLPRLNTKQSQSAQQHLLQLDQDLESSKIIEEDRFIGRWSHYRVSNSREQRLSLNKPFKKLSNYEIQQFNDFQEECQPNTIPKLKNILHQLDNTSYLTKATRASLQEDKKMKNHVGLKALVISNKQEIKSQKKFSSTLYGLIKGVENRKPQSSYSSTKVPSCSSSYQKINRQARFNQNQEKELQYQQVLSQLIKQKYVKKMGENVAFAIVNCIASDKKKKKLGNKLGLDKLLL